MARREWTGRREGGREGGWKKGRRKRGREGQRTYLGPAFCPSLDEPGSEGGEGRRGVASIQHMGHNAGLRVHAQLELSPHQPPEVEDGPACGREGGRGGGTN